MTVTSNPKAYLIGHAMGWVLATRWTFWQERFWDQVGWKVLEKL